MSKNRMIPYDDLAFESAGDFKWHIANNCEFEFVWKKKCYSVTHPKGQICLGEGYYEKDGKCYFVLSHEPYDPGIALLTHDPDDILDAMVGSDRLGDVVTQIGIIDRTT